MALHTGNNSTRLDCLKTKDLRLLNFYLRTLATRPIYTNKFYIPPLPPSTFLTNPSQITNTIINTLTHFNSYDLKNIDHFLSDLGQINIIPISQFNWLKESQLETMYMWNYIYEYHLNNSYQSNNVILTYQNPTSHKERYQNIIDYFDSSNLDTEHYQTKLQYLNSIKQTWLYGNQTTPIPLWLQQSTDAITIDWALEYIRKYNENATSLYYYIPTIPLLKNLISLEDKRHGIIAALQLWAPGTDTKTIFYQRINRAWSQRKTRQSREHMKAINTYISVQHKEMLDKLAKYNRFRMNEMLEFIIEDAYEQQRQDIEDKYGK